MKQFIFIAVVVWCVVSCRPKDTQHPVADLIHASPESEEVYVVYFYGKQRCVTCNSIETLAQETVKKHFDTHQNVQFLTVDFSDRANRDIANHFQIAWNSLIVVHQDQHVNLTDIAFLKVLSHPEGLEQALIQSIREYLEK